MSVYDVSKNLKTNLEKGLTSKEITKRKKIYGENKLKDVKKENIIVKFINQFKDFMIIVLLIAAVISAIISYLQGINDYIDSVIIVAIVFFNALMGIIQEAQAEKSLDALKKISAPNAKVKRDGKICIVATSDLVPGDIIILESGNFVPGDCRLINSYNLKIDESALTGENIPVLKNAHLLLKEKVATSDMLNMVFSTTIVINGNATAILVNTGMNTKVGKIAHMIISDISPDTPLQKKLSVIGKKLGTLSLGICFVIFVIGLLKNISFTEIFMTSVGLAVAAIPEGMPAIVTILLSIGVTKMARKNAIVRKLPAVETLGCSNVICSDKTGTLTQNKMEVVKLVSSNGNLSINATNKDTTLIARLGCLCNDSDILRVKKGYTITGDPTEAAILNLGIKIGENKNDLCSKYKRVNEIPFESSRKLMTTIHKFNDSYKIITKGAPDILLKKCTKYYDGGKICDMTNTKENFFNKYIEEMSQDALRVIAVAYKDSDILPNNLDEKNTENNLIFVGLIGMIDPPRPGVIESIATCKRAGIKTVMITGDHLLTATAIAKNIGIFQTNDIAITGTSLDEMSQENLQKNIMKYSVFARVSPEHKVRIVKAFRYNGCVVAMTGDGINDAPALKNADIGVSMGLNGTDVAKNASDIILTDDNFSTIVEAIKEGRHIYENIKKAVHFLIATNIGEIITILVGILLGLPTPLLAIHLLWINLVTDSFPAIGLGLEDVDKNIMYKKPINQKKGLFADGLWAKIIFEGTMIGLLTLFAFQMGTKFYNVEVGRTIAFLSLGLLELFHSFNIRSEYSIFEIGIFKNKYLILAFLIGGLLQVGVVIIEPIAKIFEVVNIDLTCWIFVFVISIIPIFIMEFKKKFIELKFGKVIYSTSFKKNNVYNNK
jgi:Ca2+-transporting ATPase